MRARCLLLGLAVTAFAAGPAAASPIIPDLAMSVETLDPSGTTTLDYGLADVGTCTPNSDGVSGSCSAGYHDLGVFHLQSWSSSYSDPFVTNLFTVVNTSAFSQIYDVTVTLPLGSAVGPQTNMSGSVGLTVTNNNDASATIADTGSAIYQALIDGSPVQSLFSPSSSVFCPPTGSAPFCTKTNSADFGIMPNPPVLGPQANSSIAIHIRFSLTPGDQAGVTSVFNIDPVPEPMTMVMVGLGLLGLGVAGRSRA